MLLQNAATLFSFLYHHRFSVHSSFFDSFISCAHEFPGSFENTIGISSFIRYTVCVDHIYSNQIIKAILSSNFKRFVIVRIEKSFFIFYNHLLSVLYTFGFSAYIAFLMRL